MKTWRGNLYKIIDNEYGTLQKEMDGAAHSYILNLHLIDSNHSGN